MTRLSDQRSQWVLWYLGAMSFSMLGSRLAYSDLLSSEAWQCWSTPTAWKRDSALAVVATLLAIFLLWNMQAFGAEQIGKKGRFVPSHLKRYEWAIVAATVLLLLIYTFVILPNSFREGLCARMTSLSQKPGCADLERKIMTDDYHQIMQPYNVYVLHVLGLWCGVVLPVFLFLIRCVSVDWDQWKERRSRLEEYVAKANTSGVEDRAEVFEGLVISLQDYVVGLKTVAERYVPILLGVSLILLYEQMTPSSQTVTDAAVESGKLAVWLLMGPSLLTCIIIVALGYQKAAHNAESGFRALVGASSNAAGEVDLLKRIAEARSKLIWDQSPAAFILSVVKSATVSIPLLLAVVIYVLRLHTEQWFRILVPKALVDFVQNVYK